MASENEHFELNLILISIENMTYIVDEISL